MKRALIIAASLAYMLLPLGGSAALAYNPLTPCTPAEVKAGTCTNPCPPGSTSSICADANKQAANPNDNPVVDTIAKATKIISMIIGVAAVILIVVSGLTLVLSAGSPEAVKKSRNRIIGAIVGLVVSATAWLLASFVLNQL